MAKYREIRGRIQGIENTAKITQAMKMVAAAKLRRAQDAIIAARPYGQKLQEMLGYLAGSETVISPLFEEREVNRVALVVIAADRGLAGAFNSNVIRAATMEINNRYAAQHARGDLDLICIGKRSVEYFTRRGYNVIAAYPGIFADLQFAFARQVVSMLTEGFLEGRFDRVEIIGNEFKSAARQAVGVTRLLPIARAEGEGGGPATVDYIFEPSKEQLLSALLPKHLNTQLWNALLDSNAAEHAARMAAMENATKNAKDLVRELKLTYNRARQGAITTEILEIVSGAEALKAQ
jgi:F-type H+-transporting ATPase subunit gamma